MSRNGGRNRPGTVAGMDRKTHYDQQILFGIYKNGSVASPQ